MDSAHLSSGSSDTFRKEPPGHQIEQVVAIMKRAIGGDLVAVYLHGSAVRGGLQPASDVDLLAVLKARLDDAVAAELACELMGISGGNSSQRPIELTAVAEVEIKPWRHPARREFQYGEWLRGPLAKGNMQVLAPTLDPDLTVLIAMVLDASTTLVGPPAETVFEPVPPSDVRTAILDELPAILRWVETDTTNALLTLARMWSTLSTGGFRSKADAARWAIERLPSDEGKTLQHAMDIYLGDETDWPAASTEVRRLSGCLQEMITEATGGPAGHDDAVVA